MRTLDNIYHQALRSGYFYVDEKGIIWTRRGQRGHPLPKGQWRQVTYRNKDGRCYLWFHTICLKGSIFVYLYFNGSLPLDYDVHHKDENKSNDDPTNLEALPTSIHRSIAIKKLWNNPTFQQKQFDMKNSLEARQKMSKKMSKPRQCSICGKINTNRMGHPDHWRSN